MAAAGAGRRWTGGYQNVVRERLSRSAGRVAAAAAAVAVDNNNIVVDNNINPVRRRHRARRAEPSSCPTDTATATTRF